MPNTSQPPQRLPRFRFYLAFFFFFFCTLKVESECSIAVTYIGPVCLMVCVCLWESRKWYGVGVGLNAFVSIIEAPIDYDPFPSITLYQKREKKNGKRVERGEGKISTIIKMELVSELQREITFLPFHFFRLFKITVTHIWYVIPLTRLLILSWRVFYTVETEISAYAAYIYYSDP